MTKKLTAIKNRSSLIFLFIGLLILAVLLYYLDFNVIRESFNIIGFKILIVFAVAILWIICNTLCIATLVDYKVPFHHLLYNQVTGDGYNVITPFAGLGGEPYKVKHLTNWLSLDKASEAIMRDRLIHSLSGIIYTSLTLWAVILFIQLETSFFFTFLVIGLVLTLFSALLSYLILSDKPERFLGFVLKKLRLLEEFRSKPLSHNLFYKALCFKLLGRVLNMIEFFVIFILLGMEPYILEIITVSAMLALSGTLLFIIPQGIGINEAGISGAFKLIGHSAELGLSVGLIRRARVLFWALLGIGLHLFSLLLSNWGLDKSIGQKRHS